MYRTENDLPSDGNRSPYEWKSKYPPEARKKMWFESIYLVFIFIFSLLVIFLTYAGCLADVIVCNDVSKVAFNRSMYCVGAGLLGGSTFSIKIFYRAVARGQWHEDRVFWRLLSPLMSLSVSILMAAFMSDSMIGKSSYVAVTVGYFAGYFSEHAMGKMYDIATVLFTGPRTENNLDTEKSAENGKTGS